MNDKHLMRGQHPSTILKTVREAEEACQTPAPSRPTVYRKINRWLVKESYLNPLCFSPKSASSSVSAPGLNLQTGLRSLARLWWIRFLTPRFQGFCTADAVRIKSNVRAFYLGEKPSSLKIVSLGNQRQNSSLAAEIEHRKLLSGCPEINVPALLNFTRTTEFAILKEELVQGDRCSTGDPSICLAAYHQMESVYRFSGIASRPLSECFDVSAVLATLKELLGEVAWEKEWIPRDRFLGETARLVNGHIVLPCALGHGDLSTGNMVLSRSGEVYLVDWEMSRRLPILFDLYPLVRQFPSTYGQFVQLADRLGITAPPYPGLEMQLFLAAINSCHNAAMATRRRDETDFKRSLERLRCSVKLFHDALIEEAQQMSSEFSGSLSLP